MSKNIKNFTISTILLAIFVAFTAIVKFVDVQAIGPQKTTVGLASFNQAAQNIFHTNGTYNATIYTITELLGYGVLLIAGVFAIVGLIQTIKRKSIKKVDREILLLGGLYAVTIICYILFEKFIINYRPILLDGETLEASFPSSHTMLAIVILTSAIIEIKNLIKNKKITIPLSILLALLLITIVAGRLISGVHWTTDIIGGVILSSSLVMFYYSLVNRQKNKSV